MFLSKRMSSEVRLVLEVVGGVDTEWDATLGRVFEDFTLKVTATSAQGLVLGFARSVKAPASTLMV